LLLILLPCAIFWLFFRPDHGVARDWDLFAIASVGLVPAVLMVVRTAIDRPSAQAREAVWLAPAASICLVMSAAWIGINASQARSVQRSEAILTYDRLHAGYVYANLAQVYWHAGELERTETLLRQAVTEEERPWAYLRLAEFYEAVHRPEQARFLVEEALRRWPSDGGVRYRLLKLLDADGAYEEMREVARTGTRYAPQDHTFWYYLGEVSLVLGRTEDAVAAYREALRHEPPRPVRQRIASRLRELEGEVDSGLDR
jgi:tetratricopeptide (TPR) repeat protein